MRISSSISDGGSLNELAAILVDKRFAIFLTDQGPALWPVSDITAGPPAIVLSIPKSGTYFAEALFKRMGYAGVYVHAMDLTCNDRRFQPHDPQVGGNIDIPITIISRLVLPGQIIVAHCGRDPAIEAALSGFKKIYLYRDLREVLVSHARSESAENAKIGKPPISVMEFCRSNGEELKELVELVAGWRNNSDLLAIDFADLTSEDPRRQEALAARFEEFLGWPKARVVTALRGVPADPSPTRSDGPRSALDGSWDQVAEAWFMDNMAEVRVAPDALATSPAPAPDGSAVLPARERNASGDRVAGASAQAARQASAPELAVGDSIAEQLIHHAAVPGSIGKSITDPGADAAAGRSPQQVLELIASRPPGYFAGKNVILSTGVSNVPAQLPLVSRQLEALRAAGAGGVTVLGVGTRLDLAPLNDALRDLATRAGFAFAGPLAKVHSDGVHSSNPWGLLTQARAAVRAGDSACLLDLVPGAIAAFGLRLLRADFGHDRAGAIIRLQRANDGRTEDFATLADDRLNVPGIVRLHDGSELDCATWYDQSERGNHAEAIAPRPAVELFVDDGEPMLRFRPPAQLRSRVTLKGLGALSIFAVFRASTIADAKSVARWQKEGDCVVFPYHTGDVLIGAHNRPIDAIMLGVAPGEFAAYGAVWRQGAADGFATYRNGSLMARQAAQDRPITVGNEPLFIGSHAGSSEHFTGDLVELVVWPRALSEGEIRTVSDSMRDGCAAPMRPAAR